MLEIPTMAMTMKLIPTVLTLCFITLYSPCGAVVPPCTKETPCMETVPHGKAFYSGCAEHKMDFYIYESKPVTYEYPDGPATYKAAAGEEVDCTLTTRGLIEILGSTTSCFNRKVMNCEIKNPDSLKGFKPACLDSDRQLVFWYYCATPVVTTTGLPTTTTTTTTTTATTTTTTKATTTTTTRTTGPCPWGTIDRASAIDAGYEETRSACVPLVRIDGKLCDQLAGKYSNIYPTDNTSCAEVPDTVAAVNDTLATIVKAAVRAELMCKFSATHALTELADVFSFSRILVEQMPTGVNASQLTTPLELQKNMISLLSAVNSFTSKGLWTTANETTSGGTSEWSLVNCADNVLRAVDSMGLGLQDIAEDEEKVFNNGGVDLSLRRLTTPSVLGKLDADTSVKVHYSGGRSSGVSLVATSLDVPHLLRWLRPPQAGQLVVSRVVQASLFAQGSGKLPSGASILFVVPHTAGVRLQRTRRSCVFVNSSGHLSDAGCSVVPELSSATVTACSCSHLTSFAVVASPGESWTSVETQQLMERHRQPLRLLTYICLSISIVCLLLTCLAYLALRLKSPSAESAIVTLHRVHRALCATLMVAQLLFLVGFERVEYGPMPCQVLSAITVYSFLAVFAWLLCEGFVYAQSLLVVLPGADSALAKLKFWHFCLIGFLTPAVITAVIVGVRRDQLIQMEPDLLSADSLQRPKACWLSEDLGTRWGFLGPMLTVCAVNLVLFSIILARISRRDLAAYTASSHESGEDGDTGKFLRRQLRVSLSLGSLLGLSWLLSLVFLFAQMELLLAVNYLFILLNGLQGCFLFITQVLVHQRMRDAWERQLMQSSLTPSRVRDWLESQRAARMSGDRRAGAGSGSGDRRGSRSTLSAGALSQSSTAQLDRRGSAAGGSSCCCFAGRPATQRGAKAKAHGAGGKGGGRGADYTKSTTSGFSDSAAAGFDSDGGLDQPSMMEVLAAAGGDGGGGKDYVDEASVSVDVSAGSPTGLGGSSRNLPEKLSVF